MVAVKGTLQRAGNRARHKKKRRRPKGICAHMIFLINYFLFFRNMKYLAKLMPIL